MTSQVNEGARPELVFGLVAPLGARLSDLGEELARALQGFGYKTITVRLSDLLPRFSVWEEQPSKADEVRIAHLQSMGDAARRENRDGAALARAAITEIRRERQAITGSADTPAPATAYILYQLKHPDEVRLLRQTYGSAFLMVAGHAAREVRAAHLAKRMAAAADKPGQGDGYLGEANKLIWFDQKGGDDFGQNVRDTYPIADMFVDLNAAGGQFEVHRFVDLVFGHPFHTPSPDEYAMYHASTVALRSSDINRQVGAAIVNVTATPTGVVTNSDVLALGMNEVPRGGGGFYWDKASPDARDQALEAQNENRALDIKLSVLAELLKVIGAEKWLVKSVATAEYSDLARKLLGALKGSQFMDIGEFSRPVHAEMAAIIDAARRGVSIDGRSMYVTTFPCHNCAKHIVAAGLRKVVFLEPYPKSRAPNLYAEEIVLDASDGKTPEGKVVFVAFSGVGPRLYRVLFSMGERGNANQHLTRNEWMQRKRGLSPLQVPPHLANAYLSAERVEVAVLQPSKFSAQ
ncbi:MAG: deaminase [Pseudomonadota bacterium]